MSANSRFAVATHLLTSLALAAERGPDVLLTSEELAESINTSPVVVRRIIGLLRKAGLVISHSGRGGGNALARPAARISLLDVYRAVDEPILFAMNPNRPNPACPVSCRMKELLGPVFADAEQAVEARLAKVRLSQLAESVTEPRGA